jgi:protein CpxP
MKKRTCILLVNLLFVTAAVRAQPPAPPNPEERLKHVSEKFEKELKLSVAQKEKLAAAYKEFFADIEKLRSKEGKLKEPPPPPPPPVNREAAEKLSKVRDAKIKAILNVEQYQKYSSLERSMRPPMPKDAPPMPPPGERKE